MTSRGPHVTVKLHQTTPRTSKSTPIYDSSLVHRVKEQESELKKKDDDIKHINTEYAKIVKKLKEEIKAKEKLQKDHDKTISELKRSAGKQLDKTLKDENDRMKRQADAMNVEIDELRREVDRLRTSLSKVAGERMTEGNPFVTDLSDPNRPQKLAEKFNSLYDNSWTDAFESVSKGNDEQVICTLLLDTFKDCWKHCSELSKLQLSNMQQCCVVPYCPISNTSAIEIKEEDSVVYTRHLKDGRRSYAKEFIPKLCQHYWENVIPKTSPRDESLKPYIEACLDLCWLSAICDPPIDYSFAPDNLDDYRGYTQNGDTVDFFVWPAMYLHQYGPLLYQGVVQFKPTSKGKS